MITGGGRGRFVMRETMRADPGIHGALAAAGRLPGDPAIARRLEKILERLIEVTLSDRTLWEGFLADHTGMSACNFCDERQSETKQTKPTALP